MYSASTRERWLAATGAAAIVALLGIGLILGLTVPIGTRIDQAMALLDLRPPPEPAPVRKEVHPRRRSAAKGKPSPRNLRNKATSVTAPPPVVTPPPLPTPTLVVAPHPNIGMAANSGASDRAGPGQGAGGDGNGLGGGGEGGDGDGDTTPPRQIRGRLTFSDLPPELRAAGINLSVGVRYRVEVDGHASDCGITRSSGHAELDRITCALIEKRFRFRPALDESGRPFRSTIVENHEWVIDRNMDPSDGP